MSASNAFETALLQHILQNAAIANIGDASGLQPSATAGVLWISLHSSDPGDTGDQTTNELSYTGYARKSIARSGSAWTVSGDTGTNAADLEFAECTGGSGTATHFGIGTAETGDEGTLLLSGALNSSLAISQNITPRIPAGDLDVTCS